MTSSPLSKETPYEPQPLLTPLHALRGCGVRNDVNNNPFLPGVTLKN